MINILNDKQKYNAMSKQELIDICITNDDIIHQHQTKKILNKKDIMSIYNCKSDKALKILKIMFQMGYGTKIGKEYYVSESNHEEFINCTLGKDVYI